jgi:hypothetical protein
MKKTLSEKLEEGRLRHGQYRSDSRDGPNGAFRVWGPKGTALTMIASAGDDEYPWEHVSISTSSRVPNWDEMCWIKDQFWEPHECVVQYHPPKSDYVNNHPNVLHLWRPLDQPLPMPPSILVGIQGDGTYKNKKEADAAYERAKREGLIKDRS